MSKTIVGLIVVVAGLTGFSNIFLESEVATVVNNTVQVVGIVLAWYGRVTATRDINVLGFRKS